MAAVTALGWVCPAPAAALDGIPAVLGTDRGSFAAIPPPPAPPRLPITADGVAEPEAETGLPLESLLDGLEESGGPIELIAPRDDDGAEGEPTVSVPPGIPVPEYPIVINAPVEALIDHFVAKDRDRFGLWIARSGRYLPMIRRVFREQGLPEELAYTAMIESGFSPRAVSRVGAKGMWQFMEATARRYGLVVNRWVDERLDPVKSTLAAAKYLGDLYDMFGHWFLAQAGYNAGEARVARAIARAKTSDFWALTQTRHLPEETKLFVPQILAAAVITREPARYGFDVTLESPLSYDEVPVKRALDFETIAQLADVSVEAIRDLNPALLARVTPPFGTYRLRLPTGVGARFEAALAAAPPGSLPRWTIHKVARNQSLAEIARRYRVSPQRLAELNSLRGNRLRGVTELLVPAVEPSPPVKTAVVSTKTVPTKSARGGAVREVVVRRGDTLSGIAARHRLKPDTLARLNGIDLDDPLRVGTRLRVTP